MNVQLARAATGRWLQLKFFVPIKMHLQVCQGCTISRIRFGMVMRLSILRAAVLFLSLPACAFSASNVVNLSHYDMMRPDFGAMKREGILGVIHEATYPHLVRDAKYL